MYLPTMQPAIWRPTDIRAATRKKNLCANKKNAHTHKLFDAYLFSSHKSTPKRVCMWCVCVCVYLYGIVQYNPKWVFTSLLYKWMNFRFYSSLSVVCVCVWFQCEWDVIQYGWIFSKIFLAFCWCCFCLF